MCITSFSHRTGYYMPIHIINLWDLKMHIYIYIHTHIYIHIYDFGFSGNVINAWLWSIRPKRVADIDESSNNLLLLLTAVCMLVLIWYTTTRRIPQKLNILKCTMQIHATGRYIAVSSETNVLWILLDRLFLSLPWQQASALRCPSVMDVAA